jgi:hypothetical protein
VTAALTRYGDRGRFYDLDALGESPQTEESPVELWERLEGEVFRANPQSLDDWIAVGRAAPLNASIEKSLRAWWELSWRAWTHGVIGARAESLGWQIRLEGNP